MKLNNNWYNKMEEMLHLKNKSKRTCEVYLRSVKQIQDYHNKPIERLTNEDIKQYFLYKKTEVKWSNVTLKIHYCGIKFYFKYVLKRSMEIFKILSFPKDKKLPSVLTQKEVRDVLKAVTNFRDYVFLSTVYALGLRVSEAINLQVSDIDGERMQVHIHEGKGLKDRYVPLPPNILVLLRKYWLTHKNSTFIFPGVSPGDRYGTSAIKPISRTTVQRALREAVKKVGIIKRHVSLHTLRHSYATHLLDSGVNLRAIQNYLGHQFIDTTMVYLHLTNVGHDKAVKVINLVMRGFEHE